MIRTKKEVTHILRGNILKGRYVLEIESWTTTRDNTIYKIADYLELENGSRVSVDVRERVVDNDKINQLSDFIDATIAIPEGLTKTDLDWFKAKPGLLIFVQTDILDDGIHTIYGTLPEDWELIT